ATVNQQNQTTNLRNDASCSQLPVSSCTLTKWAAADTGNQLLESFDASAGGELTVTMQRAGAPTTNVATLDVCFTPTGRVFNKLASEVTQAAMVPMTGAPRARVKLASGTGIDRQVVIPPSGVARVSAVP
ncbi:MAG TPA: hypothetical protein VLC09_12505, partial [Polyangiaceae bacterium]|nr:hypothetical protein [Polyangiaceae bacterium]